VYTGSTPPPAPYERSWAGLYATTSYAANGLVFKGNSGGLPRTFVDGTSNTIMFAERFQICNNGLYNQTGSRVQAFNLWGMGTYSVHMPTFATLGPNSAQTTSQVAPATSPPNGFKSLNDTGNGTNVGVKVIQGFTGGTQTLWSYPFQVAPRGNIACDPAVPQTPFVGGMVVGMGDGSVRTVAPTISQWTFWAACTPSGQEALGSDWQ